jgi:hypothetical protein
MIKLIKDGKSYEYKSLNDAVLKNGSTYGRNTTNSVKFLSDLGYDMSAFANITTTRTPSAGGSGIIDRLVKMLSVVDKSKVADLESQLKNLLKQPFTDKSLKQATQLQASIEQASKPVEPTLDAILAKVTELYNEWASK